MLVAVTCVACSAPEVRTTFLGSVDLVDMTDRMADSFADDPVIGRRSEASETWVVSIDRVVNHTDQVLPGRENGRYATRLRAKWAEDDIARQRSIVWVGPPERWPAAAGELESKHRRLPPTHLLAAEFQTLTLTSAAGRSDTYVCAFQLTDLGDGRLVWEDLWEVKYAVQGLTWN